MPIERLIGALLEETNMFQNILLIAIAGAVAWFLVRMFSGREKSATLVHKDATPAKPFAAVSIHPSPECCQAVQVTKGKRFLSREAPRLPLAECTANECRCVYRHHADRRSSNGDRRGLGFVALNPSSTNRRLGVGRREIDKDSNLTWV